MDFAYDQIAARTYSNDRSTTPKPADGTTTSDSSSTTPTGQPERANLQTEFQETFKAFSNSPWGTKLGGWWSTARTQGASYYETARKEAERREAEAAKALEGARRIVVERTKTVVEAAEEQLDHIVNEEKATPQQVQDPQPDPKGVSREEGGIPKDASAPEQEDTETFLTRFKSEAAKRLKEVQQAEDAADEALLRFGTNIRNFLKDTISITAPEPSSSNSGASEVLFESKDATTGKRVIHASRFDAQLHVIHTTPGSFTQDPDVSDQQWENFKQRFDIQKETNAITKDLDKYPELRSAMEKYVPEQVEYKDFWTRYYFLRHVVEMQEEKRRELLQGEYQTSQSWPKHCTFPKRANVKDSLDRRRRTRRNPLGRGFRLGRTRQQANPRRKIHNRDNIHIHIHRAVTARRSGSQHRHPPPERGLGRDDAARAAPLARRKIRRRLRGQLRRGQRRGQPRERLAAAEGQGGR